MLNPNNALKWLILLACCWPSPVAVLGGILLANAFHRGWFNFRIDRSKAPKLNWRRNDR